MSVVRSLLIKVGFQTDKSSVSQANRTVDRFKARFALIAGAATYAASKVIGFFNSVGNRLLDADNLAKSLGVSLKEIVAIQKAASNFRLNEGQIAGAFEKLNQLLIGFRTKTNLELAQISRDLKFDIQEEDTVLSLFNKIAVGLSKVQNTQEQIRIAGNIYSREIAPGIADIANNLDKFNEANREFVNNSPDLTRAVDDFKEYDRAINALSQSWNDFAITISKDVIPVLSNLLTSLKDNFEFVKFFANFQVGLFKFFRNPLTNQQPLKDAIMQGSRLLDPLVNDIKSGANSLLFGAQNKAMEIGGNIVRYTENRDDLEGVAGEWATVGAPIVTVNNEINVPPGTSQEQTQMIAEAIEDTVQAGINRAFREIQYNNPQVE